MKAFKLFKIKPEERIQSLLALVVIVVLNALFVVYQVFRHPLLSFIIWPLYLLNEGLTWLLGVNCVQYLVALPLIVCSFYSYIFVARHTLHLGCLYSEG